MLVIKLCGRAEQVFKLFAEFVKQHGENVTLGELTKGESNATFNIC